MSPTYIAAVLDRLIHNPPQSWSPDKQANLQYALRLRYNRLNVSMPYAIGAALFLAVIVSGPYPLVRLLRQTGAKGTLSVEACKDMFARADPTSFEYPQVAIAILYMAIAQSERYDVATFVRALRQHQHGARVDWQGVVNSFDQPDVRVTKQQFLAIYDALLPICRLEEDQFDIQGMWGSDAWTHPETQLSFVVAFLSTSPSELDVAQIPNLKAAYTLEEFADASNEVKEFAARAVTHPMVSYDATQALFTIIFSSQEAYNTAQTLGIPEAVINANTDVFVCAASAVSKPWAPLQEQALKQLFLPFFSRGLPNYSFVMRALWNHDKTWTAQRLMEQYNNNAKNLLLAFDHALEHNWIQALIGIRNDFGLDFTALAHSRGCVDLEKWAQDHVTTHAVPATELSRAIIMFLKFKIDDEMKDHNPDTVPLKIKTVFALLNIIQSTVTEQEEAAIQRQAIQAYPRLINYGYNFDHVLDANGADTNALFEAADLKMQEEYKDMYGGDADARKMISTLRSLKDSENSDDQELFACMIHGLFDEYNCFGEYPLEALATTAVLFGGIINYGILHSRITLSVALYMVVDAVTEYGPDDSMYKFGLQALLHFMGRLEEWPQLCERLRRVPGLAKTEVMEKAEEVLRNHANNEARDLDNQIALTNGNIDEMSEPAYQPFSSVHTDPPSRVEHYKDPDEDTSDKIRFVLNNISPRNIDDKFKDLQMTLREEHFSWFAHYLVEDLAKVQRNLQTLYVEMLSRFDMKLLWTEVLRETYVSVARVINAESTLTTPQDRTSLKDLATWLGLLTLARDKPVMHRNISFRDLLIEAYQTQRLIVAIPFTCKVLTQASRSSIFKPPNPWLMELLGLLMELYHFAELKLNLKFEIEVLCKDLNLDHKELEPLEIVRALPLGAEETLMQQYAPETDGFGDMLSLSKRGTERFSAQDVMKSLPDLANLLQYPPAPGNVSQAQLKNVFQMAAHRAIQEIIAPVVDRSVTIASISTSQLIEKDFAMEPDAEKLRQSAYNVVKALSGSLALVTCKEPLRMSMSNNIRVLAQSQLPDQLPEGSILMFVNDNLDTVCKLVEDSAESFSVAEIDAQLEAAYENRNRHRQQRPNEAFNDPPVSRWSFYMQEPYRQEQGGLNQHQLAIYEDFGRQLRLPSASHANNTSQDSRGQLPDVLSDTYLPNLPTPSGQPVMPRQAVQQQQRLQGTPSVQSQQSHPQVNGYMDPADVARRIEELILELQHVAREAEEDRISKLPANSATRDVYETLVHLIDSSVQKDHFALFAGQRATHLLYNEAKSRLEVEVFVQFLNQICAMSVSTARQLITYLSTLDDDRAFNAAVTVSMLKVMLVDLRHVDSQIARAVAARRPVVLDFFNDIIDELLLSEQPGSLRADFVQAYTAFSQWAQEEQDNEKIKEILDKLQQPTQVPDGVSTPTAEEERTVQLEYVFEEWVQLQRADLSEKSLAAFINQLGDRKVISTDEDLAAWCRVCIDASVEGYEREETSPFGVIDHAYIHVDAFAKLIASLVTYQTYDEDKDGDSKSKYLEKILCYIVLFLNDHHTRRQDRFNPRVFYRLFSSMMIELSDNKTQLGGAWEGIPIVVAKALLALQPQLFPGFTFAWVSLIAHRALIIPIMRTSVPEGQKVYAQLVGTLFGYMGELSHAIETSPLVQDLYRATIRLVALLQHDYPDFLVSHHVSLHGAVPMNIVQLNNIVAYASPATIQELPDPFNPGLKINRLDAIHQHPDVAIDVWEILGKAGIRETFDKIMSSKDVKTEDVDNILSRFESPADGNRVLNVNALIVAIGMVATGASSTFSSSSISARFVERLLTDSEAELRYHIISAMANQLRFPNTHMNWYSTAVLHYFTCTAEDVQQQLLRVLVERLLVNRPYPWGVLVTVLELLKNPNYSIFEQPWLKAAPDVERMLANIAQMQQTRSPSLG